MKQLSHKFSFLFALVVTVGVLLACNKFKGDDNNTSSGSDNNKQQTTKTEENNSGNNNSGSNNKSSDNTTKNNTSAGTVSGKLYFCEDYKNGEEIGVSDRFTPGWLTVMVKTDEPLGVSKAELRLSKVADANGDKISEQIITTIPFDIQPNWTYTYFQDKDKLKFSSPGTYRVILQKTDGTPLLSNDVEVVKR
ncbi:MAG TPA: hypothetical protein VHP32_09480 [Ignavibacteria bacterium]|nr:hypothetical protein [Ignavibacteria bacterium]